ncbi:hypothetical protein DEA8626_01856 [Defluviimonas aquaemixtae]|uniref:DUF177 domain-containing protein n=1 Tax=Albidovulum aquaemixtae TaxID=1542388 RepID=A0A2R8B703_9RHOB|nr:DUF177 domain-containing protein [Defluviimonas aquaemixtae]SPH18320.1 hypothetical protein DEA8626_01856 [Defluviimonas aquaemixtae]
MTSVDPIFTHPFRVADLAQRRPSRFNISPDEAARRRIADALGLVALDGLSFKGELMPDGRKDWILEAWLTARVTQPCVITLAPVSTEISEDVRRRYLMDMPEPEGDEVEMPEDDSAEALTDVIDAGAVLIEALTLALPPYPRAEGAELGAAQFAEPGTAPLQDEALRPFSGLADLMSKGKTEE